MHSKDDYWKKEVISWEKSVYERNNQFNLLELLASNFRKPLIYRKALTLEFLKRFGINRVICELGCGSGRLILSNFTSIKAKKIYGLDISDSAIAVANEKVMALNAQKELEFRAETLPGGKLPECDIVFGLGFLDYLSNKEIEALVEKMNCTYFLFSFSRDIGLAKFHKIYMYLKNCQKHYYITENEIMTIFQKKYTNISFINQKELSFGEIIHNFPI